MGHVTALRRLRKAFDETVHPVVNLEISTTCNYRCPFCPQSTARRDTGVMSMEDFRHVVDSLRGMGFTGDMVLSVNNEPFTHPLLMSFCELIADRLPRTPYSLISNGSLITRDHLAFLAGLRSPPRLIVDDYTPDHGIIARLKEWMASSPQTALANTAFFERSMTESLSNRAGNVSTGVSHAEDYRDIVCAWPFLGLFIRFDLRAFLCCSDFRHEVIMGDLREQSVMEIWQGAPYRDVRSKMLATQRAEIPLCRRCDAEWFVLPEHCRR